MFHDRVKAVEQSFNIPEILNHNKNMKNKGLAAAYMQGGNEFFSLKHYENFLLNAKKAFSLNKKIINIKFITRFIRSILFTTFRKK